MSDDTKEKLESELDSLVAQYLQAEREGRAPDRDDLIDKHPGMAADLRSFFEGHDGVAGIVSPVVPGSIGETLPPEDSPTLLVGEYGGPSERKEGETKDTTPSPGATLRYFGDYELLEEIARGGMGVVYKARQTSLNRIVAVKMILSGQLAGSEEIERFRTEAEAAANLKHPNIVAIHEVGEHEGQYYFSMDYVEGKSLADLVREGPLPARDAATLVKTIALAIDYAHAEGTLHRDLKPSNILLDASGQPHVTDFGLAKRIEDDSQLTASGAVLGTPSYMPPEQATGSIDQIERRSDVYSLGAILYELLTGQPPFVGTSLVDTIRQVVEAEPTYPRRQNPRIPPDLETIGLKCLEKSPQHRYGSARDLAEELGRFLDHEPIRARRPSLVRRSLDWTRRNPGLLAALAALLIFALAASVYYLVEENAFLRAKQNTPELLREPGELAKRLNTWITLASMAFVVGVVVSFWVSKRVRGLRASPSGHETRFQPFQPIGNRARVVTAIVGICTTVFAMVFAAVLIQAYVWEGGGEWNHVFTVYGLGWVGLWLLTMAGADYRRSAFGAPRRVLTAEQKKGMEESVLKRDLRGAIELYQRIFPDAPKYEATTYILRLTADRPKEWTAMRRQVPPVNWRYIAICAAIEVPVLILVWLLSRPVHPGALTACGIGAVLGIGVLAILRLRRLRLALAMACMGGVVLFFLESQSASAVRPLTLGLICGACLMISGYTPKR